MAATNTAPIPEPRGYPFIGNIADIDPGFPLQSFIQLSEKYGEIYRLRVPGANLIIVSSVSLVDELCDETKFRKVPANVLSEVRNGVHDGLFTAHIEEPNWGVAHRVLMPAFGPNNIKHMFDEMHDIASQLVLKWARQGPKHKIHVSEDFTRLALDTLALCSMGFRFNNFYSEKEHPFVSAMAEFLAECGRRPQRLPLPAFFYRTSDETYAANIKVLRETAETVLKERAANTESHRNDLLSAMMNGRDSQTGRQMNNSSIIDNLITFLIAGHETTSGTLSYAMYELLKHPEAYRKVQQEVDEVVGKNAVTVDHMHKLPYIEAVLRETLRLHAPAPIVPRTPVNDETLLRGKYMVNKGDTCLILLSRSHRDPTVFHQPDEFQPERMLSENFNKLPKHAWKPFGTGVRACIGRPFVWQEAVLAMALIFQNFDFALGNPDYVLEHQQTLTVKPKNLYITATLREQMNPAELNHRLAGSVQVSQQTAVETVDQEAASLVGSSSSPLYNMAILYGSNSGTCEFMARRLSSIAPLHGHRVAILDTLDAAIKKIPQDMPVVIFTPSYEGQPPDNAAQFVPWIESIKATNELHGVKYAVFGCGNSGWPRTFHRIPKLIDTAMLAAGAERLTEIGLTDAASDDVFVVSERWEDDNLWPAIEAMHPVKDVRAVQSVRSSMLRARKTKSRPSILGYDMQEVRVIETRALTAMGEPLKQHIEIELPRDTIFRAGDYLTVLPSNPQETVTRALRRFGLPGDANIVIEGSCTKIPTKTPISARSILADFVELGQPATRRDITTLANMAALAAADKSSLEWLASDGYEAEVSAKRMSVLDILERFPSVNISLGDFLHLLPDMSPRQYSISSSPLEKLGLVSLTVTLLREKAYSGQRDHIGIASSYLTGLQRDDLIYASVRASHDAFHLPADASDVPLIMISAGAGIAPFRGFIQERAAMVKSRQRLATAILYHGCRQPGCDDLYADDLGKWEHLGAVIVKRTYSRTSDKLQGYKYVQDAVWADRDELRKLWHQGCFVYVCGSAKVAKAISKLAVSLKRDIAVSKGQEMSEAEAQNWWDSLRYVRYAFDVFD